MKAPKTPAEWAELTNWVKRQARGRWDSIHAALAPNVAHAWDKVGKQFCCPNHPGKSKTNFRVPPKWADDGGMVCNTCGPYADGLAVLMWDRGWSFGKAVLEVAEHLHGYQRSRSPEELAREEEFRRKRREAMERAQRIEDIRLRRSLNGVWKATVSLSHPAAEPARLYLARRGLASLPDCQEVRFHPSLTYRDTETGKVLGRFPAIVARLRTADGKPGSLLRLYTNEQGDKLDREDRKKMMAHPSDTILTGGAIRLTPPSKVLGVAEGLETALAANQLFGINVWAAYSATLLEGFVPPPNVEKVIVFADKDVSGRGEEAARKLVERLWDMGIMAGIRLPDLDIPQGAKGVDWLDVLKATRASHDDAQTVSDQKVA